MVAEYMEEKFKPLPSSYSNLLDKYEAVKNTARVAMKILLKQPDSQEAKELNVYLTHKSLLSTIKKRIGNLMSAHTAEVLKSMPANTVKEVLDVLDINYTSDKGMKEKWAELIEDANGVLINNYTTTSEAQEAFRKAVREVSSVRYEKIVCETQEAIYVNTITGNSKTQTYLEDKILKRIEYV